MIHPTSMSMGRATGYSSVLGAEAYVEGKEVDLAGSGVGLNSWEELELEGDVLGIVEVLVLEDCFLMKPGFQFCPRLLGQSRPEEFSM